MEEDIAKVLVLGDSAVGKSNLLLRFCDDDFKPNYLATMGIDFRSKLVRLGDRQLRMQLWDTAGQDRFRTITQSYYKGAAGVMLVFALDDRKSFQNVEEWMRQLAEHARDGLPVVLAGNKSDLPPAERRVSEQECLQLSSSLGVRFFETSAKANVNVQQVFEALGNQILRHGGESQSKEQRKLAPPLERAKECCP